MSLYKQLWLAILFLMVLAFFGSFVVSSMSAKYYLEEQLSLKNIDTANSLALTIANTADDDIAMSLMISALFDTGHYQYVRLVDINGNKKIEHINSSTSNATPKWFSRLVKIHSQEGVAQIQQGWQQIGTLYLKSHDVFAYSALWRSSVRLFNYCMGVALLSGIVGTILLKIILQPLAATVAQAQAISNRRFITVKEPRTKEFKDVVRSMNSLSSHIKTLLEEESAKLARLHRGALFDDVTGLPNREHFFNIVETCIDSDDNRSSGVLVLIRLQNLTELNRTHGRKLIDLLLSRVGSALLEQINIENDWQVGRLNGSDFALLAVGEHEPQLVGYKVQEIFLTAISETAIEINTDLPTAATLYLPKENLSLLLGKIDAALASAEHQGSCCVETAYNQELLNTNLCVDEWKHLLNASFDTNAFSLAQFPVINNKNRLLHHECPARLKNTNGELLNAGQFIPWINRFDMEVQFDNKIIDLVLDKLFSSDLHLCINLSAHSLNNPDFIKHFSRKLSLQPDVASRLWMEISEQSAYQNLAGFKLFCLAVKPLGCHVGLKHVGHHISKIGQIHDLGLDYVKIDASITRQIEHTPAHQIMLRGLCVIVHSIGVVTIAEGVHENSQWQILKDLGVDGATGPLITQLLINSD